ncbi:MAG TPA: pyrroloquinoline quinone biosynthesis peptide chaperone PqqD [Burkholderiales bacterium]|nr:pyrroloquinoline quinone biosynthesis peptide chaperone PqqD [Burkholderiales bacterium]
MSERRIAPDAVCSLERQYRLQWEPAQECYVLLYPEGMIKLSGSAAEIMKRLDGKTAASGIVQNLEQAFPGVELREDVMDFLEVAHAKGWIRAG